MKPPSGRWVPPLWFDRVTGISWRLIVIVGALVLVVSGLTGLSVVVLPVVLGLLFACALTPVARWLRRLGVPNALAALLSVALLVAAVVAVCWLTVDAVVDQWPQITELLNSGREELERWATDRGLTPDTTANVSDALRHGIGRTLDLLLVGVVQLLPTVAGIASALILSFVVGFFFVKDGPEMWAWIVARTGSGRPVTDEIGQRVWATLSGFVLGQTAIAAIDATFISLGALLLGVPEPLAIFTLTFFGAYIPFVGAFLSGLLAVLLAIGDSGLTTGMAMLAIVIGVQVLEGNVLQPWIQGRAVRLHPLVIALSVTAGGAIAGLLGVLLAVPLTAAGVVTLSELRSAGLLGPMDEEVRPS